MSTPTRNLILTAILLTAAAVLATLSRDAAQGLQLAGALCTAVVTLWMHSGRDTAVP